MIGGVKQTATPAITNAPSRKRKRPRWQRSLIAACAAILLLVGGKLVDEALSRVAPQVLDHLPDLLNALRTAPLWAQALGLLAIGALAFGVAWLIFADRQQKQVEEAEQAEQDRAEQGKLLDAHVGEPITAAIREGFQELKQQQPPTTPVRVSAPSGLPRAVTFVGREQTLSDLMADLRKSGAVGVFALVGMGGVGKTALAAEAVARLFEAQAFPAGAAWIPCEDLLGPESLAEVWSRVARSLDASEVAALPDAKQRRAALHALLVQSERLLLALDNVDDLELGPLLETLDVQGHVMVLLTARQMINLPGLTLIPLDILPSAEAQALFAETLRRSSPHAPRPTLDDEAELPGLVADLGGLPLAIELTATYAGQQGLALTTVRREIAADGIGAAPFLPAQHPQQRALALRFDRSWRALAETPHRQRLFAALSLLQGDSFPRTAALALAQEARGERASHPSAAADLAVLVDYALVEALPGERQRLHPLLRTYAGKRLASDHATVRERLGDAMVAFWLDYARAHPGYDGMDALEAEAPGLLGALEWARDHARYKEVLALARSIGLAWDVRGRRDEELRLYPWAMQAAEALNDLREQRWVVHQLAVKHRHTGQLSEARKGFEHALTLARQLKDPAAEREEYHYLAMLDRQIGRLSEARKGFEHALILAQQLKDIAAERDERHDLAVLDAKIGRLEDARAGYEYALTLAQQSGDPAAERDERHALALLDWQTERLEEARKGFELALTLARQLSDPAAETIELVNFGFFLFEQQETQLGRAMIEQGMALSKRLMAVYNIGKGHEFLGQADWQEGYEISAITHFREALAIYEQVQSPDAEEIRGWLRRLGEQA